MLTFSAILVAVAIWCAPAPNCDRWSTVEMMADTLPFGNRYGFPFTREEFVRAQLLIYTREEAEAAAAHIYDDAPERETMGVHVMDGTLLLIALLSDDLAARVIEYRPAVRETFDYVRANREAFLMELRASVAQHEAPE
jgi:hypothetical protein